MLSHVIIHHKGGYCIHKPFITARKIAGIYWVIFSCFNSVYSPILFSCWYNDYLTNQLEPKYNTELDNNVDLFFF